MLNRILLVSIVSIAALFCQSCSNIPDCRNESEPNAVIVKFFDSSDSTLLKVKFDSIKAANTDSIFYLGDSISTYDLILDPSLNSAEFLFYQESNFSRLELSYSRNTYIISEDCGPAVSFSDIEITDHSFDSTALIFNFLDPAITENIEIYY